VVPYRSFVFPPPKAPTIIGIKDLENKGSYIIKLGARISKEEKGAKLLREYIYTNAVMCKARARRLHLSLLHPFLYFRLHSSLPS
jgi:hypothetical protein